MFLQCDLEITEHSLSKYIFFCHDVQVNLANPSHLIPTGSLPFPTTNLPCLTLRRRLLFIAMVLKVDPIAPGYSGIMHLGPILHDFDPPKFESAVVVEVSDLVPRKSLILFPQTQCHLAAKFLAPFGPSDKRVARLEENSKQKASFCPQGG